MSHSRAALILLSLLLVAALPPARAAAGPFTAAWTLSGWDYVQVVGNTDGDPQEELLFRSKVDGHLALVDGSSGVIAKEFPDFTADNTSLTATDVDQDGRLELFFWRPSPPLVTGYDWNGATYATLFSHTDPVDQQWGLANFRNGVFDALEVSSNDVRVRNLSGTVLFRASAQVAGWSGNAPGVFPVDVNQDGILELGVIENFFSPAVRVNFFRYTVGFSSMWSVSGWQPLGTAKTDYDSPVEIIMAQGADGHYGLFDGMNGGMEMEFPGFSAYSGAQLAAIDIDGDAPEEVFLWRPENLPTPPQFIAYDHNGSTYIPKFSHSDQVDNFSLGYFRNLSQFDILETFTYPSSSVGDFRVRDLNGNVIFQGSTNVPGWSGVGMMVADIDSDHDGIRELAIQDNNTLRFLRWSGATFTQSWSTTAWSLQTELSNVDGDPQSELLVASTADHHFALLNPPNGAVEQQFPSFNSDNSYLNPLDADGDGRLELFFSSLSGPNLNTAYDWTPSGWVTLFSHTDEVQGFGNGHFRTAVSTELAEFGANDLRVRDLSGVVLFRASTDLPGWTGVNRNMEVLDVDGNGVHEILASDAGHVWLVRYSGSTAVTDLTGRGELRLSNAPNPFRAGTTFRFSTRTAGPVGIRVVDASGRLVRKLDQQGTAGTHEIHWDGKDAQGRAVPPGILFYEVTADGTRKTGRMVRLSQ